MWCRSLVEGALSLTIFVHTEWSTTDKLFNITDDKQIDYKNQTDKQIDYKNQTRNKGKNDHLRHPGPDVIKRPGPGR